MKNIFTFLTIIFLFGIKLCSISAQEVILTSGNSMSLNSTREHVSYADNTTSNKDSEKHTFEFSVVSGLDIAKDISLIQSTNSNSTENSFTLSFANNVKQLKDTFSYQVYDLNGKLWLSKDISSVKTNISMSELPVASYFIMVFKNNQAVKIFKVVKRVTI